MNKVVAILGVIVLITLGGLFFCAGFFTGSTVFPSLQEKMKAGEDGSSTDTGKPISAADVEATMDTKSATLSEKIMEILAAAAETATSSISNSTDNKKPNLEDESTKVSIDSLLREIAASHAVGDDCSPEKTLNRLHTPTLVNPNSLHGKRIVFVGYFKNKIAFEIQKVLIEKGYTAHVEPSRTGEGESFIFCGPFKKEKNAKILLKWLQKHDFSEARMVNVSSDAIEETLYDAMNDDMGPPENAEKDIPEIPLEPPAAALHLEAGVGTETSTTELPESPAIHELQGVHETNGLQEAVAAVPVVVPPAAAVPSEPEVATAAVPPAPEPETTAAAAATAPAIPA